MQTFAQKKINKRGYLPIMKSLIASHMCAPNGNCGFMRTYIPCYKKTEDRSSRTQIFFKIGALKNFANFTEKDLY